MWPLALMLVSTAVIVATGLDRSVLTLDVGTLKSEVAAAWVQAVFSVAAIAAALMIARKESRDQASEAREDRRHAAELAENDRKEREEERINRASALAVYLVPQLSILAARIHIAYMDIPRVSGRLTPIDIPSGLLAKVDDLWLLQGIGENILIVIAHVQLFNDSIKQAVERHGESDGARAAIMSDPFYKNLPQARDDAERLFKAAGLFRELMKEKVPLR